MRRIFAVLVPLFASAASTPLLGQTASTLPPLVRQPSAQAVVDEHLDALNRCDWRRLMAQYPADAELLLPDGVTIRGREEVGELFRTVVKPFNEGGICGVTFTPEHTFAVGNTINVQWTVTADFLKGVYKGADAYVTRDGLMAAQVTTFQRDRLQAK